MDIINKNTDLKVPKVEIIWNKWFKYSIIKWSDMREIDFLWLSDKNKEIFVNYIVEFMKKLHWINLYEFDFLNKDLTNSKITFFNHVSKEVKNRLFWKIDKKYIDLLDSYIKDFSILEFDNLALIHTDIKKENIIIDENDFNINWIIDFSNSRITWLEEEFIFFLDMWEEIFDEIIFKYLWKKDINFIDKVKFIYNKILIFEILNNEIFSNKFHYLEDKIKKFTY